MFCIDACEVLELDAGVEEDDGAEDAGWDDALFEMALCGAKDDDDDGVFVPQAASANVSTKMSVITAVFFMILIPFLFYFLFIVLLGSISVVMA